MKLMLDIDIPSPPRKIEHQDPIMLVGSCFTEHIGGQLIENKYNVLQNPNGIVFDPESVSRSLISYTRGQQVQESDLFQLNELWHHWQFHSRFSGIRKEEVTFNMNASVAQAHAFLKKARWLIITLGTSFSYRLVSSGLPVANCHRAPAPAFRKHLMSIEEINTSLDSCLHQLFHFNPDLQVIFTVSPVRHIRDGVIENNRSKARLIEVVHHLVNKFDRLFYFPAYELVIDVLRDHRFYDLDLVHPNYQATQFVLDKFLENYASADSMELWKELKPLLNAYRHKPFESQTNAHKKFLALNLQKALELKKNYPYIDLQQEITYFSA
ncbi:MAG TPA: GSCFA domain-containing protein [Flavitalea sp.]|nr:GSCFA domain-containing protein [Flavitalea sp.]